MVKEDKRRKRKENVLFYKMVNICTTLFYTSLIVIILQTCLISFVNINTPHISCRCFNVATKELFYD